MITLFFTIIFIAELIIAFWLISLIKKCDKFVCETNEKVTAFRPIIKDKINDIRIEINSVMLRVTEFSGFVQKKKQDCLDIISPGTLSTILSFIVNNDWKKVLIVIDLVLGLKKLFAK